MNIAVDLVDISTFPTDPQEKQAFIEKFLNDIEIAGHGLDTIAGKIAVKEALVKLGLLAVGDWQNVSVLNDRDGKPAVLFNDSQSKPDLSISISHTDTLAVAVVLWQN